MIDRHMLRWMRLHLGMTEAEFAQQLGYSQPYIANIEAGRRRISKKFLQQFLSQFDFQLSDFE